ncbi:capsule biosynthesis protein [Humitalea sp. 24SJ18S-53]|uniref:capsule biosynthesis protein n=1 Tax=Humitalea sp. 24SJ18S-53 TaxID=3422307 RepID=UPI003D675BC8
MAAPLVFEDASADAPQARAPLAVPPAPAPPVLEPQVIVAAPPRPAAAPAPAPVRRRPSWIRRFVARRKGLVIFVILPLLVVSAYLYGIATPQYLSESKFQVRGRTPMPSLGGGGGAMGALMGGSSFSSMPTEALAVRDFLMSHDAVTSLADAPGIVSIWRRPEADVIARLWSDAPTTEMLVWYFGSMVTVASDQLTGITTIRTRSFRPEDSRALNAAMLTLAEGMVNRLSERVREDSVQVARNEVAVAERRVSAAREQLLSFRERERSLDPSATASAALVSVATLEQALLQTRAELQEKSAYMRRDNPLLGVLRNRIQALETEIAQERRRTTAGDLALPQQIAGYERLLMEREFADRQLASATASLEQARVEADRQQLFLARVVQPNLAEFPLYPRAAYILISMGAVLLVLYGIGWLIYAGIREHAS